MTRGEGRQGRGGALLCRPFTRPEIVLQIYNIQGLNTFLRLDDYTTTLARQWRPDEWAFDHSGQCTYMLCMWECVCVCVCVCGCLCVCSCVFGCVLMRTHLTKMANSLGCMYIAERNCYNGSDNESYHYWKPPFVLFGFPIPNESSIRRGAIAWSRNGSN